MTTSDIGLIKDIAERILTFRSQKKVQVNDAIHAIQAALIETYDYLKNRNEEYITNTNLSKLWNDAAHKTRLVDRELANQLQGKSRFWLHPDLPRQGNILLLTEITDALGRLEKLMR